jgi:hypothetical protein
LHEKRAQFNDGDNGQKAGSPLDAGERQAYEQPVSAIAQKSLRSEFPADQGRLAPVNNVIVSLLIMDDVADHLAREQNKLPVILNQFSGSPEPSRTYAEF